MTLQHKSLSVDTWASFTLAEKMAHIGSEVERALKWRAKQNIEYMNLSLQRCFELIDLTLDTTDGFFRLREIARLRESIVDYFLGENTYLSSDESFRNYFMCFNVLARKSR